LRERGGPGEEVERAIRDGAWAPASRGKWHAALTLPYNQPSPVNGQMYASKTTDVVFALEDDRIVVIAVKVYYHGP